MLDQKTINDTVQRLLQAAPQGSRVILFGSHARGTADGRSDIDLMVVEPEVRDRHREAVRLQEAINSLHLPVDLIVTSQENFEYWRDTPNTLYYKVAREGRVYGA